MFDETHFPGPETPYESHTGDESAESSNWQEDMYDSGHEKKKRWTKQTERGTAVIEDRREYFQTSFHYRNVKFFVVVTLADGSEQRQFVHSLDSAKEFADKALGERAQVLDLGQEAELLHKLTKKQF